MEIKFEEIIPERAEELLSNRIANNRQISLVTVQRYANDMRHGKWKQTHQLIALNEEGRLIDGQHRLYAVIEAGIPVKIGVAYGVESDSMMGIDSGLTRRAHDILTIATGMKVTATTAAIARSMIALPLSKSARSVSPSDLADFMKMHKDAIAFTNIVFQTKKRGITRAPMMAAFARAFYTQDNERLLNFGRAITFGIIKDEMQDSAAIRLREYAILNSSRQNKEADLDYYRRAEKAIQNYCHYIHVKSLIPATHELFEIPGD